MTKLETNRLYYYAQKLLDKPTEDSEIRSINMTEEFWKEIEAEIKNDEIVKIQITGKPRTKKSTVAIHIAKKMKKIMIQNGKA